MLDRTNSNNMNPNRDTARLLNYKEMLKEKNLVAVSLVDCVPGSREFVKLDFTETKKIEAPSGVHSECSIAC